MLGKILKESRNLFFECVPERTCFLCDGRMKRGRVALEDLQCTFSEVFTVIT